MPVDTTVPTRRPYPIFFVVDASGSMAEDGKAEVLELALGKAVEHLARHEDPDVEILACLIIVAGESPVVVGPVPVADMQVPEFTPSGRTDLGAVVSQLVALLVGMADNAYPAACVLLSDGHSNDDASGAIVDASEEERFRDALRVAVRIGADADDQLLREFAGSADRVVTVSELTTLPELLVRVARSVESSVIDSTSSRTVPSAADQ